MNKITHVDRARQTITALRSRIPDALKADRNFLLWSWAIRDGKRTKIPYRDCMLTRRARPNDPTRYLHFTSALALLSVGLRFRDAGLGFVLTPDGPYVGVDLDKCRDPETGTLEDWAQEIVDRLPGYWEVSPSGRGVKGIFLGRKPLQNCRTATVPGVEIYGSGSLGARYFALTGALLPGAVREITNGQAGIDWLCHKMFGGATKKPAAAHKLACKPTCKCGGHTQPETPGDATTPLPEWVTDVMILERARAARNGAKFSRLWEGDASDFGGDESARDQSLCNRLAFWCGNDLASVDRLFRQSGCYRSKWDRDDYRARTLANSVQAKTYRWGAGSKFHQVPQNDLKELATSGDHHRRTALSFRPQVEYAHCFRLPAPMCRLRRPFVKDGLGVDCKDRRCPDCRRAYAINRERYYGLQVAQFPEVHMFVADESEAGQVAKRLANDRRNYSSKGIGSWLPQYYGIPLEGGKVLFVANIAIKRDGAIVSEQVSLERAKTEVVLAVPQRPVGKRVRSSYDISWQRVFDEDTREVDEGDPWVRDKSATWMKRIEPERFRKNLEAAGIATKKDSPDTHSRDRLVRHTLFEVDRAKVAPLIARDDEVEVSENEASWWVWTVGYYGTETANRLLGLRRLRPWQYELETLLRKRKVRFRLVSTQAREREEREQFRVGMLARERKRDLAVTPAVGGAAHYE